MPIFPKRCSKRDYSFNASNGQGGASIDDIALSGNTSLVPAPTSARPEGIAQEDSMVTLCREIPPIIIDPVEDANSAQISRDGWWPTWHSNESSNAGIGN